MSEQAAPIKNQEVFMSDSERREFHQQATAIEATAQPERGKLHVHFHVHPLVSLIITVLICFILLVVFAAYAIFHHESFISSTTDLFANAILLIKSLAIMGL